MKLICHLKQSQIDFFSKENDGILQKLLEDYWEKKLMERALPYAHLGFEAFEAIKLFKDTRHAILAEPIVLGIFQRALVNMGGARWGW